MSPMLSNHYMVQGSTLCSIQFFARFSAQGSTQFSMRFYIGMITDVALRVDHLHGVNVGFNSVCAPCDLVSALIV